MRKNLIFLIVAIVLFSSLIYGRVNVSHTAADTAGGQVVISMGQDLTAAQRDEVLNYFAKTIDIQDNRLITVSNQEERKYLEGKIDTKVIGTKAISSACVSLNNREPGIEVKTNNISWVSPFMYANALNTAGVSDALILVTAPFEVSGTAALTGIIKAFELAAGTQLSEGAKETAHQEVAETSKLGQKIGQDKAGKFIYEVKRQVIAKKISDPEEIRRIIIQVSADLNVELSEEEIQRIIDLMQNLNSLNINISKLNQQLDKLQQGLEEFKGETKQARGFIQKLVDFINNLLHSLGIL